MAEIPSGQEEEVYWQNIRQGDKIPSNAVKAGTSEKDGDMYIGRDGLEGTPGKIITKDGNMDLLKIHGKHCGNFPGFNKPFDKEGQILCLNVEPIWQILGKGDAIPSNAVHAGRGTSNDGGAVYAGRACEGGVIGEPGKINCGDDDQGKQGTMWKFWGYDSGDSTLCEILLIPLQDEAKARRMKVIKDGHPNEGDTGIVLFHDPEETGLCVWKLKLEPWDDWFGKDDVEPVESEAQMTLRDQLGKMKTRSLYCRAIEIGIKDPPLLAAVEKEDEEEKKAALIDLIATHEAPEMTTVYLPNKHRDQVVLLEAPGERAGSMWRSTNAYLKSDARGLNFRASKDDSDTIGGYLAWGKTVQGTVDGDWTCCKVPRQALRWVPIRKGEHIPRTAAKSREDGDEYVGRRLGKAGKITTKSGSMQDFRTHGGGRDQDAEILCLYVDHRWQRITRGEKIPLGALLAGTTCLDGDCFVGRALADGEAGKINCGDGKGSGEIGTMWNLWAWQSGKSQEAEILILLPAAE